MIPGILLGLVILVETPDNLTPEAKAELKEMRASMKEAVALLEDRKYVEFLDRYLGKHLSDESKGLSARIASRKPWRRKAGSIIFF